jgi:penicillin-binding protein 2
MWKAVNAPGGTAWPHATSKLVEIAGKTGTAQVKAKRARKDEPPVQGWHPGTDHAWFAGWAPAAQPEIAIVVLIEHGGSGGKVAGPVAKTILEGWATLVRNASPVGDADRPASAPGGAPSGPPATAGEPVSGGAP